MNNFGLHVIFIELNVKFFNAVEKFTIKLFSALKKFVFLQKNQVYGIKNN